MQGIDPGTAIEWGSVSDAFDVLDKHLIYVDAPLEGFVTSHVTGQIFAFRCIELLPDMVWHWVLVPVVDNDLAAEAALESARSSPPCQWLSVLEDRRTGRSKAVAICLDGGLLPGLLIKGQDAKPT